MLGYELTSCDTTLKKSLHIHPDNLLSVISHNIYVYLFQLTLILLVCIQTTYVHWLIGGYTVLNASESVFYVIGILFTIKNMIEFL